MYQIFLANSPVIAQFKNINFLWVGMPDDREGQVENGVKLESSHFSREISGNCSNFDLEGYKVRSPLFTHS